KASKPAGNIGRADQRGSMAPLQLRVMGGFAAQRLYETRLSGSWPCEGGTGSPVASVESIHRHFKSNRACCVSMRLSADSRLLRPDTGDADLRRLHHEDLGLPDTGGKDELKDCCLTLFDPSVVKV